MQKDAGFVMKKYGVINDVLSLNWLPIEERVQMYIENL